MLSQIPIKPSEFIQLSLSLITTKIDSIHAFQVIQILNDSTWDKGMSSETFVMEVRTFLPVYRII